MRRISTPHLNLWKVEKLPSVLHFQRTVGVWTKVLWIHFGQLTMGTFLLLLKSVSYNFKESTALWLCCQRANVVSKQKSEQQHNCYIEVQINYCLVLIRRVSKPESVAQSRLLKWQCCIWNWTAWLSTCQRCSKWYGSYISYHIYVLLRTARGCWAATFSKCLLRFREILSEHFAAHCFNYPFPWEYRFRVLQVCGNVGISLLSCCKY